MHQGSGTNTTEPRAAESVIFTGGTLQDRKGDRTNTSGKVITSPKAGFQVRATRQMTSRPISSCARSISSRTSSSYTSVIR